VRLRIAQEGTSRATAGFANALIETRCPASIIYGLAQQMNPQSGLRLLAPCSISSSSCSRRCGSISGYRCGPARWPPYNSWYWAFWLLPVAVFADRPEETIYYHASRSVVLLLAGLVAGMVALSLRRQFANSVAAAQARDRVTNLFGQHVSPAVVDSCSTPN